MKRKIILVLSVLLITVLLSGCGYELEKDEINEIQRVANEFLTQKGYEIPREYTIRYVEDELMVSNSRISIYFSIPFVEIVHISNISKEQLEEIQKVGNDFLNTAGYIIPEGYEIKYLGERKEQLQVKKILKEETTRTITITFNISKNGTIEIEDIQYDVSLSRIGVCFLKIAAIIGVCIVIPWILLGLD